MIAAVEPDTEDPNINTDQHSGCDRQWGCGDALVESAAAISNSLHNRMVSRVVPLHTPQQLELWQVFPLGYAIFIGLLERRPRNARPPAPGETEVPGPP
jgi:hypothetical protein